MTTETLIIKFLFLVAIGITFFVFEGIVILDLFSRYGQYWSKTLFEAAKDRNHDGKTTFWEGILPNDGGHFVKRCLVALIGSGVMFTDGMLIWQFFVYSFIAWWIISAVFELAFSRFRKYIKSLKQ